MSVNKLTNMLHNNPLHSEKRVEVNNGRFGLMSALRIKFVPLNMRDQAFLSIQLTILLVMSVVNTVP